MAERNVLDKYSSIDLWVSGFMRTMLKWLNYQLKSGELSPLRNCRFALYFGFLTHMPSEWYPHSVQVEFSLWGDDHDRSIGWLMEAVCDSVWLNGGSWIGCHMLRFSQFGNYSFFGRWSPHTHANVTWGSPHENVLSIPDRGLSWSSGGKPRATAVFCMGLLLIIVLRVLTCC